MSLSAKLALGTTALLLGGAVAYHWYVGAAILGVLFDGVCWVFPVCPTN